MKTKRPLSKSDYPRIMELITQGLSHSYIAMNVYGITENDLREKLNEWSGAKTSNIIPDPALIDLLTRSIEREIKECREGL